MTCSVCGKRIVKGKEKYYRQPSGKWKHAECSVLARPSRSQITFEAAKNADWMQVVLNQGPPCFHLEGGRFCLRAERWDGHRSFGGYGPIHNYISLETLLRSVSSDVG